MGEVIMDKKIIVISAVWCPSCLILKKHLKKLKENYSVDVEMYDYDFDEDIINKYDIGQTLPVIIIENKKLIGERTYEEIVEFLAECGVI